MDHSHHTCSRRSWIGIVLWLVFGIAAVIYLVNPGAGIVEAIPDNVPLFGNLDEAGATLLVLSAIRYLTGIDLSRVRKAEPKRLSVSDLG